MSALELTARLTAWLVSSGFVLLLAFLVYRPLRSDRLALNALIYLLLAALLTTLFTFLAGLAALLRPAPMTAIAVVGWGVMLASPACRAALREIPVGLRDFKEGCRAVWDHLPRWLQWVTAAGVVLGTARFAVLIWTLPPFVWDALTYHLTNVAHWTQAGRIELFETPVDRIYSPANYEVLATWFTVFLHHDVVVEAAGLPAYALGVASVYCIGRYLGVSRAAAWLAALVFGSTPALLIAITGTKNDPHMAGYYLAAMALVLELSGTKPEAGTRDSLGALISLALALLLAAGTKAYIANLLPGLALVAALNLPGWGSPRRWRDHLRAAARQWLERGRLARAAIVGLLLAGLLLGGYWNVRNWILTSNPFYPYGVIVEGSQVIQGPESYYHLGLDRMVENLANLAFKFGDKRGPIRPDLPNTTGWGWFAYALGLPAVLLGLIRRRSVRVLSAGFLLSFVGILLSNRPSPWNMRYVVWLPALFALAFATLWDSWPQAGRRALRALLVGSLALNFSMTLNYNKISAEEFRSMLALPALQRDAAVFEDNMPGAYGAAIKLVPKDALLGYNVHNNGFVYPLYRSDLSQRLVYVAFSPADTCQEIADRMRERGTRYLLVAPEQSTDENIAKLRECAAGEQLIRERAQGLYVLR